MSIIAHAVDLVPQPERKIFVQECFVRVVPKPFVSNESNSLVDPVPPLFRRVGQYRNVVGHVVAVKKPDLWKPRLQLGDKPRILEHVVVQPLILHEIQFDPKVVHHETAKRADRGPNRNNRGGVFDGDIRISQAVSLGSIGNTGQHRTTDTQSHDSQAHRAELNHPVSHHESAITITDRRCTGQAAAWSE